MGTGQLLAVPSLSLCSATIDLSPFGLSSRHRNQSGSTYLRFVYKSASGFTFVGTSLAILAERMVPLKTDPSSGYWINHPMEGGDICGGAGSRETVGQFSAGRLSKRSGSAPGQILFDEFRRLKPSLDALGIGFSVSRAKGTRRGGRKRKPPYFACCYDPGSLEYVNVVAFYYPLIADWEMMESEPDQYRRRVKSALREEMIHAIQVLTVKNRYERSSELAARFSNAEEYYNHLLGRIFEELARNKVGEKAVITAAKLYYEDWTISSLEKLRRTDLKYHGRDGYLVCELIRQVAQIRFGELMSEEAKGRAWDKHRIFFVGEYGTTENLMLAMAATLRQAVPELIDLSPKLAEALAEIEATIQTIGGINVARLTTPGDLNLRS
jgi:hypothetical protein